MRTDKRVTLRIGYREFVVSFVNGFRHSKQIGECEYPMSRRDNSKGKIRIKKGQDNVEKANTILHEIMHALFYTQGIGCSAKEEERIVCALTNGLIDFIRQNPSYTRKLLALLKE